MSEYSDKFKTILADLIDVMVTKGTTQDHIECLAHMDELRKTLDKATWQHQAQKVTKKKK